MFIREMKIHVKPVLIAHMSFPYKSSTITSFIIDKVEAKSDNHQFSKIFLNFTNKKRNSDNPRIPKNKQNFRQAF